jgi:hypothetical protein
MLKSTGVEIEGGGKDGFFFSRPTVLIYSVACAKENSMLW